MRLYSTSTVFAAATLAASFVHAAAPPEPEVFAEGLEIPWALDFAPDGRIFVTERAGRIRVIERGVLQSEPWATLQVANWRAAGLSGLALDPDFAANGHVYVVGTFRTAEDGFVNRVYRFTERHGKGAEPTVIVGDMPSIDTHAGGAFAFGPDGLLYLAMGDAENIDEVQDLDTTTGKILRYHRDGSPADNPFTDSPVYALGVRNPQGFAWHPETGHLFATEHGPSGFEAEGGREHQDELNVILPGANYGWPDVSGMHKDARFVQPLVEWTPAIAPSGLAIVTDKKSPWYGHLFAGALGARHLRHIVLDRNETSGIGWRITVDEAWYGEELGRIRAARFGPDGYLYFTTSNRDTPGEPKRRIARPGDDKIYRVRMVP